MNEFVENAIREFAGRYCVDRKIESIWQDPLVAVAKADDTLFDRLKEVVSPTHASPRELLPSARSVLVYFLPFVKAIPKSNKGGELVSVEWAAAYVETNRLIIALNQYLESFFEQRGFISSLLPPTHNFDPEVLISDWSHKHVAYIAGLGDFGHHHQLITEKGCCGRLGSLITEAPLQPSLRTGSTHCLNRFDDSCAVCQKRCPVNAIKTPGFDRHGCYDLLLKNERAHASLGITDVCGKCVAMVPCSFLNPVPKKVQKVTRAQLTLAEADRNDLLEILRLQKQAYQSEADRYDDPDLPPMKQTIKEVRQEFENQVFLKAAVDDRIVGSVRLAQSDGTAFIGKLIVHPDFQQQGIARKLMDKIEMLAGDSRRFELFTGHQSTPALNLYHSMGYQIFKSKELETHSLVFLEKKCSS